MKTFRTICVVLALGLTASVLFEARHEIYALLAEYRLVPIEEGLTELYFENSDALPERAGALSFSFILRNLEGKRMVYPYVVYVEYDGERTELTRDVVTVLEGERALVTTSVVVTRRGSGRIVVELPDQNQHIAFLIS